MELGSSKIGKKIGPVANKRQDRVVLNSGLDENERNELCSCFTLTKELAVE